MSDYPSDWKVMALGEVAEVVGGGTPSRDTPAFWGDDHYWITPSEVVAIDGKMASHSKEKISNLGLASSGAKLHPPGTILMTSRASIGFAAIAVEDICTNQGFQSLRCGKALDNWFALHQIRHRRAELQQLAAGSTFLEVSGSNIRSFPFVIPPLPEQKKIAEILSGIDTAINKIATAIVKSDTALTGIFAELDLIAAAGKISTLGEIARVQNGYAFQSSIFTEDSAGIPLVRISNISGGLVDTSKSKRIPQTLAALGEYKVSRGDILIAMSGATTGKIGIYHGSSFCLLNQRVGKFVFRPGSKSIAYATQLLLSGFLESRILAKAAGGAQPNISGKGIEAIEIPFPDTAEQDKYAITIQEFLRVNAKRRILMEKYQHLKSALSSDLLSGRKRVSI
jgi:type I restriction enzyme S subunit